MNKFVLCVLSVLCLLALLPTFLCFADTVNGVLAEERVVNNLPQDSTKWYVSVVGNANDPRYVEIVGWFNTNASLKKVRDQVHFCPVTSNTGIYKERYAGNIKGLPTVRMQKADGAVVYEAAGKDIPMTAGGLNGALANGVYKAEGIRPILPWRREMERRCPDTQPQPQPGPDPQPDPDPQPIDNDGPPNIDNQPAESQVQWVWFPLLCVAGLLAGLAMGYGKPLYRKMHPAVR